MRQGPQNNVRTRWFCAIRCRGNSFFHPSVPESLHGSANLTVRQHVPHEIAIWSCKCPCKGVCGVFRRSGNLSKPAVAQTTRERVGEHCRSGVVTCPKMNGAGTDPGGIVAGSWLKLRYMFQERQRGPTWSIGVGNGQAAKCRAGGAMTKTRHAEQKRGCTAKAGYHLTAEPLCARTPDFTEWCRLPRG